MVLAAYPMCVSVHNSLFNLDGVQFVVVGVDVQLVFGYCLEVEQ